MEIRCTDSARVEHRIADDLEDGVAREAAELLVELDAYLGAWNDFARLYPDAV